MGEQSYIACDLGAGSGRVMLGRLADNQLALDELHRFASAPVTLLGSLRWDMLLIYQELKAGLREVAASGQNPASLSVDSWGVDYVLFNAAEPMLGVPYHYRDVRNEPVFQRVLGKTGAAKLIFGETGIQFLNFNTLYQLLADMERDSELLQIAESFLGIADYLHFLFCGAAKTEESFASTTQLYNPRKRSWSRTLIHKFELPPHLFTKIVPSGTALGQISPELQEETGLAGIEVVATCSHDTGAAVAAVPASSGDDWAYLSSGTWSLIGVELSAPLITEAARTENFTNEAGYGGTTRFLKNIAGMWLLQQCQRTWESEGRKVAYGDLDRLAGEAESMRSLINPNAARFMTSSEEMPLRITEFCRETDQPAPETQGQFIRCIFESLALLYRDTLTVLERLTGRTIRRLHIVGGGSQSMLLNQFAADATGCEVLAGPVEGTAVGNIMIQAVTVGHLDSLQQAREIVRASFPINEFQPQQSAPLRSAFERFAHIRSLQQ